MESRKAETTCKSKTSTRELPAANEYTTASGNKLGQVWSSGSVVAGATILDSPQPHISSSTIDGNLNRVGSVRSNDETRMMAEEETDNDDVFWTTQGPCQKCQRMRSDQSSSSFWSEPVTWKQTSTDDCEGKEVAYKDELVTTGAVEDERRSLERGSKADTSYADDNSSAKQRRSLDSVPSSSIRDARKSSASGHKEVKLQRQASLLERKCCSLGTLFSILMAVLLLVVVASAVLFGLAANMKNRRTNRRRQTLTGIPTVDSILSKAVEWYTGYVNWIKRKHR